MSKRQLSQYYLTIYSTVFDAGGNFLAAGNNHGTIAVFNLVSIFETNEDDDPVEELDKPTKDPFYQFQAHRQAVYSMVSTGKVVVSGSVGEIRAWNWVSLKTRDYRRMWTLKLEPSDNFVKLEVNALALSVEDSNKVYAGCGDNVVYCIDVEKGKTLLSLRGHTDYVHCVIANDANKCISGSEDGSVRLWDTRGGREMASFEPYKHEAVRRPEIGKWIGCVAVDSTNEWLVCGGGPSLYMWNLPTLSPLILMPKEDIIPSVVRFCGDSIVSGGSEPRLNFWSFNGRLTNVIKVPPSHVFGIGIGRIEDRELLSISGCSYKIEVFNTSRDHECTLMFTV